MTTGDKALQSAYDEVKCIKLTPTILHQLYAIDTKFCAEQLALANNYKSFIESVPKIKSIYNTSRKRLEKYSKRISDAVYPSGLDCKQYIIDSISMLNSLNSLAELDEQYQYKNGKVCRADKELPVTDYLEFYSKGYLVSLEDSDNQYKFQFPSDSKFKFLNKGERIPDYRRYTSNKYSEDYIYYHKSDNGYEQLNIDSKTFNPNDTYYVCIEVNCEALKNVLLLMWSRTITSLNENFSLLNEFSEINRKSLAPTHDGYSITISNAWKTRSKHRAKQCMLIEIKDSLLGLHSNAFADKWNSSPGENFKVTAANLMLNIERMFKEGPKLISTAVKSIFEPMGAVIVSPIGPAACTTNIVQILGTVTRIVAAASALASLVVVTLSQLEILGISEELTPSLIVIITTLNIVTGVIVTLNKLLSKLPQL